MPISKTSLTGAAGEHYVMFRLLRMGYIAGLAPEGAPNADIIVTNTKVKKSVAIQVKTRLRKGADNGWHMKEKHEKIKEDNLFYCFVDLSNEINSAPVIHVIPSRVVASILYQMHRIWLATPGRNGRVHNNTVMRRLLPDYQKTIKTNDSEITKYSKGWMDKYKEKWGLLKLEK